VSRDGKSNNAGEGGAVAIGERPAAAGNAPSVPAAVRADGPITVEEMLARVRPRAEGEDAE
jgi:hypothetical protein